MSEWQPIETAPKDGTLAILFAAGRTYWREVGGVRETIFPDLSDARDYGTMCDIAYCKDGRWLEAYSGHDLFEPWIEVEDRPTHWTPLPPPPTE